MNITIQAEDPKSPEAIALLYELERSLEELYPAESRHDLELEKLELQVLRYDGHPAGCGGLVLAREYAELKRIFVRPGYRGRGLGEKLVLRLEQRARELGFTRLRLETGQHQGQAIRLYQKLGFEPIPAFGPYLTDPLSLCYEKGIG